MEIAPIASVSSARKDTSEVKPNYRTIVLCFEGTGYNGFDVHDTNVYKLYSLLINDGKNQLCYHREGIGTYPFPHINRNIFNRTTLILDKAIACYLRKHVIDGYKFLMRNYDPGDRVCLFGFSRGAYIARALAGMLFKVGLLLNHYDEKYIFSAYKIYKSTRIGEGDVSKFREMRCRSVLVDFVGVCTKPRQLIHRDTVGSVGVVMGKSLPFVDENTTVRVFRHGLSLDEHRHRFRPNLYGRGVLDPSVRTLEAQDATRDVTSSGEKSTDVDKTDVKEVWFAGYHCDVGGGNASSDAKYALAHIPLRWMIQEIKRTGTHIMFDEKKLAKWNITHTTKKDPDSSIAQGQGGGGKEDPDALDAVQQIIDPLSKSRLRWTLEIIPTAHTYYEKTKGKWKKKWRLHRGSGREVPPKPLFHPSVKTRMNHSQLEYSPKANYDETQVKFES